tara:strand:- start:266 stop:580 length:315 start_codon:yes stop_codon:yes gene_type:complete
MNEEELLSLDGENVTVAVSSLGFQRNGFFPQMSINGRLEINTNGEITQYRIVNSENTYVYFHARDVYLINSLTSFGYEICPMNGYTELFEDIVLHTRIDTPKEE